MRQNELDIEGFEARAAETVGEMKALFREFQDRLGEVMGAQRLASTEARNEAATARGVLENLARAAQTIVDLQRQAVKELCEGWQLHVREDSRVAGEEIARAFGAQITTGLQQQLEGLSATVQAARRVDVGGEVGCGDCLRHCADDWSRRLGLAAACGRDTLDLCLGRCDATAAL